MSAELSVLPKSGVPEGLPEIDAAAIERVLLQGDLSKLTDKQRLAYYNSVCQSLHLNPLTRPFDYVVLNGKMTLYAKRECTEQLRKMYGISVVILERAVLEGVFIVRAQAVMPNGRTDESIGAVAIDALKGEGRANAMMKAETKAKRRVTLSICGMAFMDESEAPDVKGAYQVPVDPQTGAIAPLEPAADLHTDIVDNPPAPPKKQHKSTTPFDMLQELGEQKKRLYKAGSEHLYYRVLKSFGKAHANEFGQEEQEQMHACYKELSLEAQEAENRVRGVEVYRKLPDCVEANEGTLGIQGGKTWMVHHGPENSSWLRVAWHDERREWTVVG